MTLDRTASALDFFDAWERHDVEGVLSRFAQHATFTDSTGHREGIAAIRATVEQQMAAVTEIHPTFNTVAVGGGTVVVERREDIVFNGAPLIVEGVVVLDVTDDGLVTRFRDYYDPATIRRG